MPRNREPKGGLPRTFDEWAIGRIKELELENARLQSVIQEGINLSPGCAYALICTCGKKEEPK